MSHLTKEEREYCMKLDLQARETADAYAKEHDMIMTQELAIFMTFPHPEDPKGEREVVFERFERSYSLGDLTPLERVDDLVKKFLDELMLEKPEKSVLVFFAPDIATSLESIDIMTRYLHIADEHEEKHLRLHAWTKENNFFMY